MTAEETISEAREIRALLPNDDYEAFRCSVLESDFYAARRLNHGPQMEAVLAKINLFIINNRERANVEANRA